MYIGNTWKKTATGFLLASATILTGCDDGGGGGGGGAAPAYDATGSWQMTITSETIIDDPHGGMQVTDVGHVYSVDVVQDGKKFTGSMRAQSASGGFFTGDFKGSVSGATYNFRYNLATESGETCRATGSFDLTSEQAGGGSSTYRFFRGGTYLGAGQEGILMRKR